MQNNIEAEAKTFPKITTNLQLIVARSIETYQGLKTNQILMNENYTS